MAKPTIGRVVWYHPKEVHTQPHPALICYVWADSFINIAGFDAEGEPFRATWVPLKQEGAPIPEGSYAEWMPYQIQKAKEEIK